MTESAKNGTINHLVLNNKEVGTMKLFTVGRSPRDTEVHPGILITRRHRSLMLPNWAVLLGDENNEEGVLGIVPVEINKDDDQQIHLKEARLEIVDGLPRLVASPSKSTKALVLIRARFLSGQLESLESAPTPQFKPFPGEVIAWGRCSEPSECCLLTVDETLSVIPKGSLFRIISAERVAQGLYSWDGSNLVQTDQEPTAFSV